MSIDNRRELKEAGKGLALDTFLEVAGDTSSEFAKESFTNILGDIAAETVSSLVPGLSGAYAGYKRAIFERNISRLAEELKNQFSNLQHHLEAKDEEQKGKIDELFSYIMDYVVDEKQEEKIKYMVNGFVNITMHETVTDDFVLTYYDVLRELRMVDI